MGLYKIKKQKIESLKGRMYIFHSFHEYIEGNIHGSVDNVIEVDGSLQQGAPELHKEPTHQLQAQLRGHG